MGKFEFTEFMMLGTAVFMAYIAYQQYWLNRNKLKLELYEKRLSQFRVFKDFLFEVTKKTIIESTQLNEFNRVTNECEFLFENDIACYRKEISENVKELRKHERDILTLMTENDSSYVNFDNSKLKRDTLQGWFDAQYLDIESKFHKYLYFKNI